LDRLLIIRTLPYHKEEITTILGIRAKTEGIALDAESLEELSQIGVKSSLRYAIQLLTPSNVLANINGRQEITLEDVQEVDGLFYDSKSSAQILQEQKQNYVH
jgi:RuvB-like protein 1 (pontin 52)